MTALRLPEHFFTRQGKIISDMKAEGLDVIRVDVGSPDMPPHPKVVEVLSETSRKEDVHGYQSHWGTHGLRLAWEEFYAREFGVSLDPDCAVLPLLGSKEGIFLITSAVLDPGDGVLVPDPGYVTYRQGTRFARGKVLPFRLSAENNYLPLLENIPQEHIQQAKIIWLNYPNNPTTATTTLSFFQQMVAFARKHELLVCHDAAYGMVTFDQYKNPSILQVKGASDVAVEFNTLSKSHNMAGWRCGVVVGNVDVVQRLLHLKTNSDSGHFLPVMEAAIEALSLPRDWIDARNLVYQERRDFLVPALAELGFNVQLPKASIYVWAGYKGSESADALVQRILRQCAVSIAPGTLFGEEGEGFLRLSLTQPLSRLQEVVDRLAKLTLF